MCHITKKPFRLVRDTSVTYAPFLLFVFTEKVRGGASKGSYCSKAYAQCLANEARTGHHPHHIPNGPLQRSTRSDAYMVLLICQSCYDCYSDQTCRRTTKRQARLFTLCRVTSSIDENDLWSREILTHPQFCSFAPLSSDEDESKDD